MAGVLLDAAFGGAKALGAIPGLETLMGKSAHALKEKLARPERSQRTLFIRGVLAAIVTLTVLFGVGLLLNKLVFMHPTLMALATITIAKFIRFKVLWREIVEASPKSSGKTARNLIGTISDYLAFHYITMALAFLAGGFALLLPYFFALQTVEQKKTSRITAYTKPFRWILAPILWPGAFIASILFALATLFIPSANWPKAWIALSKPVLPPLFWPLKVLTYSFNWAIEAQTNREGKTVRWIGPKEGRSQLTPKDLADALFVTLVVFALTTALLMLPVLIGLLR
jgi:cobalamin biosynthesis protein CobD/CbiB